MLESLLSVVEGMTGRSGTRNECLRGAFSASLEEENLDSGACGISSESTTGGLFGGMASEPCRVWGGIFENSVAGSAGAGDADGVVSVSEEF